MKIIAKVRFVDFQILYKAVRNDSYEFKNANYSLRVAMCHYKEEREEEN